MIVVGLPGDPGVGSKLASCLGVGYVSVFSKRFPDGEIYLRLPQKVEGSDVLLVQSMYPAQSDRLVELLLALEVLSRYENRVNLLITYLAYARQDREFLIGESVSLKSVVKALTTYEVDVLVTIDAHNPHAIEKAVESGRYLNIVPGEVFAEAISRKYRGREITVVAPDRGALSRAQSIANHLNCGYIAVQKVRDRVTGRVEHIFNSLNSISELAIVVDDIVSTGGTIAGIASYLTSRNIEVVAAISHALLVGDAYERLVKSGVREIYTLQTVPQTSANITYLDIASYLARELRREGVVK